MKPTMDDLIAKYLADEMDAQERASFELRMATEPDLAAEVRLEQELGETLNQASAENQLRASLRNISGKFDTPESLTRTNGGKTRNNAWIGWLVACGLFIAAGVFIWNMRQPEHIAPSAIPVNETPSRVPTVPEGHTPEKVEEKNTVSQSQPIAGAFKPIPKLETYIGSQVRSEGMQFQVETPRSGMDFQLQNDKVSFQLAGKMVGKASADATFRVLIFSNNKSAFERLEPAYSQSLELNATGAFQLKKQLKLPIGLYYLLIEEEASGAWLFVDKFFIK
jgi:hypothetical protein